MPCFLFLTNILSLPHNCYSYSEAKEYLKQEFELILDSKTKIVSSMHDRQRENLKSTVMREG